ncbi:MAG: T9SS type A sorting domain-containing protein [Flavobacteriaceae bacterium]|nr:T9SS type A sorting domain-containing protein [Flavobacteriaceae bacterium]
MKKITLFFVAVFFSVAIQAQTTLTHNTDDIITSTNSVACQGGDNLQARVFILGDFGITNDFEITEGAIGVQSISADINLTVSIYVVDDLFPAGFPGSSTLLGSQNVLVPFGSDLTIVDYTFDTPVLVPAGTERILVEVAQVLDGISWFIGGTAGQTDHPWLASVQCQVPDYTAPADIGFPDAHYYINVTGDEVLSVGDNLADAVSIFPVPAVDVINIKVPSNVQITDVALFDLLGKNTGLAFSGGQINVENLSRGVYILTVKTSQGTLTQKIVKK